MFYSKTCPLIHVLHVYLIWTTFLYSSVRAARSQVDPGKHCVDIANPSGPGTVEACANCFFPQNCLETNECLTGSIGELCERCEHYASHNDHSTQGYYRVANTCTECLSFPWALIALGVFLVIILMSVAYNGLTPSVATKIKEVVDFLQYLILSFSIKVSWSNTVTRAILVFTFSFFTASVATPACIVAESVVLYYLEWGVSLILVLLFLVLTCVLDFRRRSQLKKGVPIPTQKKIWRKRAQYRRLAFLILMIFYVPVAVSAIQSFSCTASLFPENLALYPGKELFLYDLTFDCDEIGFSGMNSSNTLVLIAYNCFLPLLVLFFTLRQRKWGYLQPRIIQYGPIYETYKDRWCFWEALVMSRKLVYIVITNTYPISPAAQAIGHLTVTGIFLVITVVFRPFRKYTWKPARLKRISPTAVFEVSSALCIMVLETQGLLIAYGIVESALDWLFIVALAITLTFWLLCILSVQRELPIAQFENCEIPQTQKKELLVEQSDWMGEVFSAEHKMPQEKNMKPEKELDNITTHGNTFEAVKNDWENSKTEQGNTKKPEIQVNKSTSVENEWDKSKTQEIQLDNATTHEKHQDKAIAEDHVWFSGKTLENQWDSDDSQGDKTQNVKTVENEWKNAKTKEMDLNIAQDQKHQNTDPSPKKEMNIDIPSNSQDTHTEERNNKTRWTNKNTTDTPKVEFEENSDNSSLF